MTTITIARDIMRLTDSALKHNDDHMLMTVQQIIQALVDANVQDDDVDMALLNEYMEALNECEYCRVGDNQESREELRGRIIAQLADRPQKQVAANDKLALELEPMVRLVTAMYAKDEDGTTAGVSIALVVDHNGVVSFPREHFLNQKLLEAWDDLKLGTSDHLLTSLLPKNIGEYQLVEGLTEMQKLLPRELSAISF